MIELQITVMAGNKVEVRAESGAHALVLYTTVAGLVSNEGQELGRKIFGDMAWDRMLDSDSFRGIEYEWVAKQEIHDDDAG